jgi:hypothetical protein
VANASSAVAARPNVFLNGGQSVDVGTLSLGGSPGALGIACRVPPLPAGAVDGSAPSDATPVTPEPPDTTGATP